MLHEVLLALSGHPSPLFDDSIGDKANKDFPLSPSERALLQTIGRLSELHRKLKRKLENIRSGHPSVVCRATANSLQQTHLARFQRKILDVESKILKKDAALVGAYEIVPLASVVGEFDDWHRRMAWYWQVACFIEPDKKPNAVASSEPVSRSTGSQLIDRLRVEARTGFPDIEEAAVELSKTADTAWLKQLSSWVVFGNLPQVGASDFFIQRSHGDEHIFLIDESLLPSIVTPTTAASILFIGKSLHQVEELRRSSSTSIHVSRVRGVSSQEHDLTTTHLRLLSTLTLPLVTPQLSQAISAIRLSLSQKVLQHLLPIKTALRLLFCLRQFFLFDYGEFAAALISEAEKCVRSRQRDQGRLLQQDPVKALEGLVIKDTELHQTLQQSWRALLAVDDDGHNDVLEFAQRHMTLTTPSKDKKNLSSSDDMGTANPGISNIQFNDLLFPNLTELGLTIEAPLDLLISQQDLDVYSHISGYLLAIRRGCLKLSDLWRRSPARRSAGTDGPVQSELKLRHRKRDVASRKVWASCSAANFMLAETAAYFEGEVIRSSCDHFQRWVEQPGPNSDHTSTSAKDESQTTNKAAQRDPESLATGHRTFLASLTYALLMTDTPYTKNLRALLGNIDNLVAFFNRLLDRQQKLDHEAEAGDEDSKNIEDEQRIALELDRARKKVDSDLKSVVHRLRQVDADRIGSLRYLDMKPAKRGDFEPWKPGGVDRLLMKLEFGRMLEPGFSIVK